MKSVIALLLLYSESTVKTQECVVRNPLMFVVDVMGHILWIPLRYCLAMELPSLTGGFKAYIALLMVTNGISLVFDITDVWRYMRGDR